MIPPLITRHNIPRRPQSSLRSPGRIFSIWSQGVQTSLTSSRASPIRSRCPIARLFTFSPVVVMFSRRPPGRSSMLPKSLCQLAIPDAFRTDAHARSPQSRSRSRRGLPQAPPSVASFLRREIACACLACCLVSSGLQLRGLGADVLPIMHSIELDLRASLIGRGQSRIE